MFNPIQQDGEVICRLGPGKVFGESVLDDTPRYCYCFKRNNDNIGIITMENYIQQIPGNIKIDELQRITLSKTLRLGTGHKFIFTALLL